MTENTISAAFVLRFVGLTIILLCSLLTSVMTNPSLAAQRALVIGNDAYDQVAPLQRAVNDAWTIGDALAQNGYDVDRHANLRRRDFSVVLSAFVQKLNKGDEAVFFYAGHGVAISGENFLLPIDIPNQGPGGETFIKNESFGLSEVLEALRSRGVSISLLIIDACRNNPFKQEGTRTLGTSRGLLPVVAPEGTFIMYSAGVGQQALDSLGANDETKNSIFVRSLAPLLVKPGLSLPAMARLVRKQVNELASRVSHKQRPAYYDEILGDFFLAGKPESVAQDSSQDTRVAVVEAKPTTEVSNPEEAIFRTVPWNRSVGNLEASGMAVGSDQSIYVVGGNYGNNKNTLDWDGSVAKLGSDGREIWRKNIDPLGHNNVSDVIILADGNIAVTGYATPDGFNQAQFWLSVLDPGGDVLFEKTLGAASTHDHAFKIKQLENGNFVLAGYIRNQQALTNAGAVLMIDPNGKELWRQVFSDDPNTYAYALTVLPDGDIVVGGETGNPAKGGWAARVNQQGRIIWQRSYTEIQRLRGIIHLSSGHLGYVGTTLSKEDASTDMWVAKVNLDGNVLYEKSFGADGREEGHALIERAGKIIAAGVTTSKGAGAGDAWLLELETWQGLRLKSNKTYGTAKEDEIRVLALLPDGGLVAGGKNDNGGWAFAVSPSAEARGLALSDSFTGTCLREKQWTANRKTGGDPFIYVGLNYCEAEEAEPILQFSCGPESKSLGARADVNVRDNLADKTLPITISVDGKNYRFSGKASFNEMQGVNEIDFEVPFDSPVITNLSEGNRAVVSAGRKRINVHLKDSGKALQRLRNCKVYAQALAAQE